MRTLLLAAVLSGLVSALQAQHTLPLLAENKNLTGTWYKKALVRQTDMIASDSVKDAFPMEVTSLDGGNLEVKEVFMIEDQCHEVTNLLQKTEEPGTFTGAWDKMALYIYEVPGTDHYIFLHEVKLFEEKFQVADLLGRDKEVNLEALEEFKKFAQFKDLEHEDMVIPEQREKCVDQSQAVP